MVGTSLSFTRPFQLSSALPNALQLSLPAEKVNGVRFANMGYSGASYRSLSRTRFSGSNNNFKISGIKVTANTQYEASFYYRYQTSSQFSGTLKICLQGDGGTMLAMQSVGITGSQTTWKQVPGVSAR